MQVQCIWSTTQLTTQRVRDPGDLSGRGGVEAQSLQLHTVILNHLHQGLHGEHRVREPEEVGDTVKSVGEVEHERSKLAADGQKQRPQVLNVPQNLTDTKCRIEPAGLFGSAPLQRLSLNALDKGRLDPFETAARDHNTHRAVLFFTQSLELTLLS